MARDLFAVMALAVVGAAAAAPPAKPEADKELQAVRERVQAALDDLRAKAAFPGVGVGVVLADGRSVGVACGLADVENKVALKPTDRLLAGSVGKTFVAAAVLQLVEGGKLALDDRAEKWVGKEPWFARLPNAHELTVRSLLNHTSGLPEWYDRKGVAEAVKADPDREWAPADRLAFVLDAKPPFAVGKGWSYADTNYILLGQIAEKAGGKPLFEQVEGRLLKPLKLGGIVPSDRPAVPGLVAGYAGPRNPLGFDGRTTKDGKLLVNPQVEWAGGGLATTPEDLARWAKLVFEGKAFEKKETLEAMLAGVDTTAGRGGAKGPKYGLGVQIRDTEWGPSYGHGGWFPGYRTEVAYFPNQKAAVAVQFNTDVGPSLKKGVSAYLADVARVVFGPGG
jgi:D-alanyl-D-alanine carboxypeptidase